MTNKHNQHHATITPTPPTPTTHALVTGGAGFVGSHLVDTLLAQGQRVTVIDDLSTGSADNLTLARGTAPDRIRFIHADLAHAAESAVAQDPPDATYHLAAAVGVQRVVDDPVAWIETNVFHTAALLRALVRHAPTAPVLIASTSEAYGKSAALPFRETDDLTLGPSTAPRWSYAASKIVDEHLALAHHAATGLPAVIARFFNIVGPRQSGRYGMVLPRFVTAALRNTTLNVYGDGMQSRCFSDVRDITHHLPNLINNRAAHGRIINVGSDRPISINELARLVTATLNQNATITHIPYTHAFGQGFEDLHARVPDLTTLRSLAPNTEHRPLTQTILDIAKHIQTERTSPGETQHRPSTPQTPAPRANASH